MLAKGNKVKCRSCGSFYYDLNKPNHSCPKCAKKSYPSKGSFTKKVKKTPSQNTISPELELFEVNAGAPQKGYSLNSGTLKLDFEEPAEGWYCAPKSLIKGGTIGNRKHIFFLETPPSEGLISLLSSTKFKGIGRVTASEIAKINVGSAINALGQSVEFIQEQFGVSKEVAKSLQTGWMDDPKSNLLQIILLEIGLTGDQIKGVLTEVGAMIIPLTNENPFKLISLIPRFDFEDVDRVVARLNIGITNEQRVIAASEHYLLDQAEKRFRHTCLPLSNLVQRVSEMTSIEASEVENIIQTNRNSFFFTNHKQKEVISTIASGKRDDEILAGLKDIIKKHKTRAGAKKFRLEELNAGLKIDLSGEQLDAVELGLSNPVSLITGGPGSGKTTMLEGLVRAFESLEASIRICAPTGKAANRISENRYLSKFKPSTIHRFLATHSLHKFDVMIIDEASMIDVNLMLELLASIPSGSSLIFVGDADQLPPVGPGQPFKDFLNSENIPTARLTGNFRQDSFSDTVKAARNIIRGNLPEIHENLSRSDFTFFECPKEQQASLVLRLYFDLLPSKLGVRPIDLQILTPQRPGHVGMSLLNDMIQARVTDQSKVLLSKMSGSGQVRFFAGDKVIQRKNNYDKGIVNGDQGTLVKKEKEDIIIEFNGRNVRLSGKEKFDIDLAYATTVHSSQGSEYPGVIIPITSAHSHMLSRQLIYTAVTRGKKQVCLVGEAAAFERALAQYQKDFRWTGLGASLNKSL